MTAHRSGRHRIDPTEARRIREEFAFDLLPRAKKLVREEPVDAPVSTEHAEYLAAHQALLRNGWTLRAIARHLNVSHRYLIDLRRGHRPARTECRDWVQALWSLLATNEPELPSSGTWG